MKLNWRPRELNTLADELTNEVFDHFDQSKRVHVGLDDLDLGLMHKLSEHHSQFLSWRQQGVCQATKAGHARKVKHVKSKWG